MSSAFNQNSPPFPENVDMPIRKSFRRIGEMRVVGELRTGEILLEHEAGVIITYNAKREEFRELTIDGLPEILSAIMMTPNVSLSSISTILRITDSPAIILPRYIAAGSSSSNNNSSKEWRWSIIASWFSDITWQKKKSNKSTQ